MLKNKAVKNESILKPCKKWSHNIIIKALITKRNSPRVKRVIGKVKNTKIGFTKTLSKLKTTATLILVKRPSMVTPDSK